jgi:hypothetical protein
VAQDDSEVRDVGPPDAGANRMKKVLLVFPVFQAMYPRPFNAFAELLIAAGRQADYLFGVLVIERSPLVAAMNSVGERMIAQDWDACIVFDDDCFPPHDVVPRLLARCFDEGHAFVAAAGVMRGYPFTTTVAKNYTEGMSAVIKPDGTLDHLSGFEWMDDLPEDLIEVGFCGVPAAIIHKRCFEQIPRPWFGDLDVYGERITHDVFFCRQLKLAGIPVLVDGTIRCGHLTDPPVVTFENRAQARKAMAT